MKKMIPVKILRLEGNPLPEGKIVLQTLEKNPLNLSIVIDKYIGRILFELNSNRNPSFPPYVLYQNTIIVFKSMVEEIFNARVKYHLCIEKKEKGNYYGKLVIKVQKQKKISFFNMPIDDVILWAILLPAPLYVVEGLEGLEKDAFDAFPMASNVTH